jgi:aspartate aminotransferase
MYGLGSARSAIRELFEYGKQRAAVVGAENIYDYSLGNPAVPSPDSVNDSIIDILRTEPSIQVHGYTSAQGDAFARGAIAEDLNKRFGTSFHKDNFYITCGAAAALAICLSALVVPECDEVIAIAPFFPEYGVFAGNAGAKFVVVPPDKKDFQIDMEALASLITPRTRAVIVNSPNNPSGAVYSEETIKQLAALLKERSESYGHAIVLISDEPYREIVYDGLEVPYITKYYKNTLVCYSYSKSLSLPGERIGYVLVPDEVEESAKVYAAVCGAGRSLGYVCPPSLMQRVITRVTGQTSDISQYRKNRDLLYGGLKEIGYECVKPQGAFYLFLKILGDDTEAFCERAKALDLLVVNGTGFGCPGYVRLAYCVSEDMIKRSLPVFKKLYDSYR